MQSDDSSRGPNQARPIPTVPSLRCAAAASLAGLLLSACATSTPPADTAPDGAAGTSASSVADLPPAERLDATMLIGPTAARTLGYRIDWEADGVTVPGTALEWFRPSGDSVFTLDARNGIVRLRNDDGTRVWRSPVGGPIDRLYGGQRVTGDGEDRLYVLAEGDFFVVDVGNGVLIDRQPLDRVANTAPVRLGRYMIYGTRAGQIVWHQFAVGHPWRLNQTEGAIKATPLIVNDDVLVVSTSGSIMMMDGRTAERLWSKRLLAGIAAGPAAGEGPDGRGLVFVAGEDQYLWALDRGTGTTVWKTFFESPLLSSPVLIGDRLFVQVPSEGLVCFEAFPADSVDGVRLWTSPATGDVIGQRGDRILVWDDASQTLTTLDAKRGGVVDRVSLPHVNRIKTSAPVDGDLYASSKDGRVTRLVKP